MTRIAQALQQSSEADEVGLIRSRDGSNELSLSLYGAEIEASEEQVTRFSSLFATLPANFYTPWHFYQRGPLVVAQPGEYFPGLFIMNSGPWCGGSDEEWRAEHQKEFSAGVGRGGPILFAYNPDGFVPENACTDAAFLSEERGFCELNISDNWAMVFEYFNGDASEQP